MHRGGDANVSHLYVHITPALVLPQPLQQVCTEHTQRCCACSSPFGQDPLEAVCKAQTVKQKCLASAYTLILNSSFFWMLIICSVRLIFRTPSLHAFTTWEKRAQKFVSAGFKQVSEDGQHEKA